MQTNRRYNANDIRGNYIGNFALGDDRGFTQPVVFTNTKTTAQTANAKPGDIVLVLYATGAPARWHSAWARGWNEEK